MKRFTQQQEHGGGERATSQPEHALSVAPLSKRQSLRQVLNPIGTLFPFVTGMHIH